LWCSSKQLGKLCPYAPLNKVLVHVSKKKNGQCERTIQSPCNVFNLTSRNLSQSNLCHYSNFIGRTHCWLYHHYHTPYCQLAFLIFQNIAILYNLIDTMLHRQFPLSNNNKKRPMFNIDMIYSFLNLWDRSHLTDVQLVVHNSQYNVAWQR